MTDTKTDEQYVLACKMADEIDRVLAVCDAIQERNRYSGEPWDDLPERIIDEHIGDPLSIDATCSGIPLDVLHGYESYKLTDYLDEIEVLLGTGGPARGITFRSSGAYPWHQDWFTPRVHTTRPLAYGEVLASHWGIDL